MAALEPGLKDALWPPGRQLLEEVAPLVTAGLFLCLAVIYLVAMRVESRAPKAEPEAPYSAPDFRLTGRSDSAGSLEPRSDGLAAGVGSPTSAGNATGSNGHANPQKPHPGNGDGDGVKPAPIKTVTAVPEAALDREKVVMKILQDARQLIGWEVEVEGYGVGIVEETRKRMKGFPTLFRIRFDDGRVESLSLKRSRKKGKIPFKLRGATEVALQRMKQDYGGINISPALGRRGSDISCDSTIDAPLVAAKPGR
uniref:Uncharacterized protein n=1 Tax=Pinguiococcus pyrenoidosus TaxID=172671 RepID=A0A7R9UC26_9STRA|mmetsp:Transcript_5018/g.20059  ORF Transcript_5018/g.20059 Transcript_5018/m.20059 type:complete len:254 (+) Transcript_5018:240-1001(+)